MKRQKYNEIHHIFLEPTSSNVSIWRTKSPKRRRHPGSSYWYMTNKDSTSSHVTSWNQRSFSWKFQFCLKDFSQNAFSVSSKCKSVEIIGNFILYITYSMFNCVLAQTERSYIFPCPNWNTLFSCKPSVKQLFPENLLELMMK